MIRKDIKQDVKMILEVNQMNIQAFIMATIYGIMMQTKNVPLIYIKDNI